MGKKQEPPAEHTPEAAVADGQMPALDAGHAAAGFGDLDKVRQILFGAQTQQIDQRLTVLEKHVAKEFSALRTDLDTRLAALQEDVEEKHEALRHRMQEEEAERSLSAGNLGQEIESVAQALQENRGQIDAHLAETQHALEARLDDASQTAARDRQARFDDLTRRLEEAVAELRHAKTDRVGLADLLDHLSERLRQDA